MRSTARTEDTATQALPPSGPQAEDEPLAPPPGQPQPAPRGSATPSWRAFDKEEQERRCKGDKLAAAIMLVLLVVARSRAGVHETVLAVSPTCATVCAPWAWFSWHGCGAAAQVPAHPYRFSTYCCLRRVCAPGALVPACTLSRLPNFPCNPRNPHLLPLQEVHSASALALCILVLLGSQDMVTAGWYRLRGLLVTGLKLAAATAPLFRMHALSTLQVRQLLPIFGCKVSLTEARHGAASTCRPLCLPGMQLQRAMDAQEAWSRLCHPCLQENACGSGAAAGGAALLRITLADHSALLAFTGIVRPAAKD